MRKGSQGHVSPSRRPAVVTVVIVLVVVIAVVAVRIVSLLVHAYPLRSHAVDWQRFVLHVLLSPSPFVLLFCYSPLASQLTRPAVRTAVRSSVYVAAVAETE